MAQNFTGQPGKYVSLKDTIKGFKMILNGECDALPEQAFYMVGTIEEAIREGKDAGARSRCCGKGGRRGQGNRAVQGDRNAQGNRCSQGCCRARG